jgi:hypothetical protein
MTMASSESNSNLWSEIRESVGEYCDEHAPAGDWHISRDPCNADVLAFNFFFPLRQDTEGLSDALSTLRGLRTLADSLDLVLPTVTEAIGASELRPASNVVISFRDDAGTGLLLLKCTFKETDLGACTAHTTLSLSDGHNGRAPDGAACSASWCGHCLTRLPGSRRNSSANAARQTCPFAEGGHQAMRGLLLARTMVEAWNADTVEFGLICDSRNTALRSRVRHWNSRVHLMSWSYQEILSALSDTRAQPMRAWRAFLRARYGLVPAASRGLVGTRHANMSGQPVQDAWRGRL